MQFSAQNIRRNRLTVPAFLLAVTVTLALVIDAMADRYRVRSATIADSGAAANVSHDEPIRVPTGAEPDFIGKDFEAMSAITEPDGDPGLHDVQALLGPVSAAQLQWLWSHGYRIGYRIGQIETDIPFHEQELLRAAALTDDPQAIDHYAALLALRGEPDAVNWLKRSATQGSTQALLRLAAWHNAADGTADRTEAMAWLLVAERRGDPFAAHLLAQLAEPDEVTAAATSTRAQALYQQLERERYRRGLSTFDNTVYPNE